MGGYAYMHVAQSAPFFMAAGLGAVGLAFIWLARARIPQAAKA
jgi:hypothetical protein